MALFAGVMKNAIVLFDTQKGLNTDCLESSASANIECVADSSGWYHMSGFTTRSTLSRGPWHIFTVSRKWAIFARQFRVRSPRYYKDGLGKRAGSRYDTADGRDIMADR